MTERLKWTKPAAKCIARIKANSPHLPEGVFERLEPEEQRGVIHYAIEHWRGMLVTMDALIAKLVTASYPPGSSELLCIDRYSYHNRGAEPGCERGGSHGHAAERFTRVHTAAA